MQNTFSNAGLQHSEVHRLPIEFISSGSEYFRIWIVNLLLMFVTFGIYYPWAKVRRLRCFHANTQVGKEPMAYFRQAAHNMQVAS